MHVPVEMHGVANESGVTLAHMGGGGASKRIVTAGGGPD
jgi:hypothetical protein